MFKIEKIGAFGNKTVKDLFEISDQIDFDPPYQRHGNIWKDEKKKLLIDSIINSYDLPKFYLHYISDNNDVINKSGKPYAIIDGKQRLQAIFEFLRGDFRLDSDFVYESDTENYDLAGLSYSDIAKKHSELKYKIDNFNLDIVFVITDEIERLEELFYRLNEGMPLNNAEKRNRIVGFVNDQVRRLISSNTFFTQKVKMSGKRLQYEDLCLKLFYTEFNQEIVSFDKEDLDNFVEDNKVENNSLNEALKRLENNLEILSNVFLDSDELLKSRGIIPVYYYFITRDKPRTDNVRDFLKMFETIRVENRKRKDYNPILVEFDRQNQQGVYQLKSQQVRYNMLERFYSKYLEGELKLDTQINLEDLRLSIEN